MTSEFKKDKSKDKVITKSDLQAFKKEIETRLTGLERKVDRSYQGNEKLDMLAKFILDKIDAMENMIEDDFQELLDKKIIERNQKSASENDFLFNHFHGVVTLMLGGLIITFVLVVILIINTFFIVT